MIRILQVGASENLGGIESYLYNQAKNLDYDKVIYDFLCPMNVKHIPYEEEILQHGGKVYHLTVGRKSPIAYYRQLLQIFRENTYTGVVLNLMSMSMVSVLWIAKHCNVPVRIMHSHNGGFEMKHRSLAKRIYHRLNRWLLPFVATEYFACSKLAGDWMFGKGEKYTVIPNAIDCELYRYKPQLREKMREQLQLQDKFVIGHVARFARQKNNSFLIDIFHKVHKKNPHAVLLLIGKVEKENPYYQEVQRRIASYGLRESVMILGLRQNIPELMQAMDCFVLPSLFEGLPVVGIEAQASGLPCYFADTITKETAVTQRVKFVSLKTSPGKWADEILAENVMSVNRSEMADIVAQTGYDIRKVADDVQNYYVNHSASSRGGA